MVKILHLANLHFFRDAQANSMKNVLLKEARAVHDLQDGEKLLIITGDFHNYWDEDYAAVESFIKNLIEAMNIDPTQDVFIIPGNHDVGNERTLQSLLEKKDTSWRLHNKIAITMLKNGDMSFLELRLQAFLPYSDFAHRIEVYTEDEANALLPARVHVRSWRGKLNILHLNTALVADGTAKDSQMVDVESAVSDDVRAMLMKDGLPVLVLGHNNFFDLDEKQQKLLQTAFGNLEHPNVSAYLCGDTHKINPDDLKKRILLHPNDTTDPGIANIICVKGISDNHDTYSDFGFFWHEWNESSDAVLARLKSWDNDSLSDYYDNVKGNIRYKMRNSRAVTAWPSPAPIPATVPASSAQDSELKMYLKDLLRRTRDNHPSFVLLKNDGIDEQLYPGVKEPKQFETLGKTKTEGEDAKSAIPVWDIIRKSWTKGKKRNIVIEGKGGIGKTVTLFGMTDSEDSALPPAVYVPMHKLVDREGNCITLAQYIRKLSDKHGQEILDLADSGWDAQRGPRLLILLDGFNEVPADKRRTILHMINDWNVCSGAQLIVVSRSMDGVHLSKELADHPIAIELEPLSKETAKAYLAKFPDIVIPPDSSPLWNVLTIPLFLKFYQKTDHLAECTSDGYTLALKESKSDGALIWNLLQRELLRVDSEIWVLRCAFACEYILPYIAFALEQEQRFTIKKERILKLITEVHASINMERLPRHLTDIVNKYKARHHGYPDLSTIEWYRTILDDIGLLRITEQADTLDYSYCFIHQFYRDVLAGVWLVNQAEMMKAEDELPEVWQRSVNHVVMDYAADLIEDAEAAKLWETNRKIRPTNPSFTYTMLELQKRRNSSLENLDFSGMDLREISLTHYLGKEQDDINDLKLFSKAELSINTYLDESVFHNPGHEGTVGCVEAAQNGQCISGSDDGTLRIWDPMTGHCLKYMSPEGNEGWITCMAILPDGQIVSGSHGNILRVWDAYTGYCHQILQGHTDQITCVTTLPNGNVVSGSYDGTLRIWNLKTRECLRVLKEHEYGIHCVAVLPDRRIISGSSDNTLRVWDAATGQCLQTLEGHEGWIRCMTILPDGRVVSGSYDHTLRVWDAATGQCLQTLEGNEDGITCMTILPDGRVVSGSSDHTLRVWDAATGQCLQTLEGNEDGITCMTILPDGRVVSGSSDHTLRVWDAATGQCLQTLEEHTNWITCLAVLPGGLIVSGSIDRTLRVWDLYSGQCLWVLEQRRNAFNIITILPDGRVVSGSSDNTLRVWNVETGRCLHTITGHTDRINCMAVFPDGRLVSGSDDHTLRIWDTSTGHCLQTIIGHIGRITCLLASPDGHIISASDDHTLRVWDSLTGQCLFTLEGHSGWINSVIFHPDGYVVSASSDSTLRVWDIATGQCLHVLEGHTKRISCLSILPDGLIISGSDDNTLRIWDIKNDHCLHTLKGHLGWVTCIAILPDGRVISGSDDNTLRVWDVWTGNCLQILKGHTDRVNCVSVLLDGRVISGSNDRTLRIWDIDNGRCLQTISGHTGAVICMTVHQEGWVITGADDNTLRLWDTQTGKCLDIFETLEVDVSNMDLSKAILTDKLATLLWQNGAKISDADYERYIKLRRQE